LLGAHLADLLSRDRRWRDGTQFFFSEVSGGKWCSGRLSRKTPDASPHRPVTAVRCAAGHWDRRATQRELPPPNLPEALLSKSRPARRRPRSLQRVAVEAEAVPAWVASGRRPVSSHWSKGWFKSRKQEWGDWSTEDAARRKMTTYRLQTRCDAGSKPAL